VARQPDGSQKPYVVYDHAFLAYRDFAGLASHEDQEVVAQLPAHWVTAHQIHALDHAAMSAAVAPYVDTAISKTVNVAEEYPYEAFVGIYR